MAKVRNTNYNYSANANMSSLIEPPPPNTRPQLQPPPRPLLPSKKKRHHFERAPMHKATMLPQPQRPPITAKFQDKAVLKRTYATAPPFPLKTSKPWPGTATRSPDTTDELVKHMSNVPSYLQTAMHTNEDNIQGKALNVGVLEWGALERYTGKMHSASTATKVAPPLSSQTMAPTPKQQHPTNCFRDLDPDHSTSVLHYKRSISLRNSKDGTTSGKERCHERGRQRNETFASYWSPVIGGQIEKVQRGFSAELSNDFQAKDGYIHVPYSCPLPFGDADTCTTASCSSSNNSSLLRENAEVVSFKSTSNKQTTKELSPSCRMVEPPPVASRGKMGNMEAAKREAASSTRGRQSPLRRMLDPLLKSRNTVSTSHHESTPIEVRMPISSSVRPSNQKKESQGEQGTQTENSASLTAPSFYSQSNINLHLQHAVKTHPFNRQALLQLTWKRGLPVFMFSCESDILGATVRSKCIPDATESYSIFTLQESKMKGGAAWIRPGNKGKKQNLVSNIVGEMRVSTCKSKCHYNSGIYHVSREFVLVGPQLIPASNAERAIHEIEMESPVNMELAAIVTSLPTNDCLCDKTVSAGSVTAIIPSGIHGISAQGEPSPLIERWRSGGECDCGGWDEGCRLSLLSLEFNSEGSKSKWEETQARFELFSQGHSKEGGHAFSMICFKEGLYTVEFKSSIPLRQAFAICISLLHSKSPLKQEIQQEKTLGSRKGGPPTSYLQCHPPHSFVGRA